MRECDPANAPEARRGWSSAQARLLEGSIASRCSEIPRTDLIIKQSAWYQRSSNVPAELQIGVGNGRVALFVVE